MKNLTEKNLEDQNKNHRLKNIKLDEEKKLRSEILKQGNDKNPFAFMPMGSGKPRLNDSDDKKVKFP